MEVLALEKFFEEMSESGYLVIGNTNSMYEFKKSEPKKRRFHVEYFSKASVFDSKPEKKTQEFIDYCEVAGWNHCFSAGKMQCFYTEDMESPDIETDDDFKFRTLTKAAISSQITVWLLVALYLYMGVNQGIKTMNSFYLFSRFLTSRIAIGMFLFFSIFIIIALINFIELMTFYIKNRKNLSIGDPLALYDSKSATKRMQSRLIFLAIMFLGLTNYTR